ncbi:MAG: hypothetical protein GY738_23405 [Pseudoalteromonas sp.]|nr:hypothetical protein [Pseudoalteromonas sp.]
MNPHVKIVVLLGATLETLKETQPETHKLIASKYKEIMSELPVEQGRGWKLDDFVNKVLNED